MLWYECWRSFCTFKDSALNVNKPYVSYTFRQRNICKYFDFRIIMQETIQMYVYIYIFFFHAIPCDYCGSFNWVLWDFSDKKNEKTFMKNCALETNNKKKVVTEGREFFLFKPKNWKNAPNPIRFRISFTKPSVLDRLLVAHAI